MEKTSYSISPWFFCYLPRPDAKIRLFCFPHGGGGPQAYLDWAKKLSKEIEVMAICLPGRSMRFKEDLFTNMDDIISNISKDFVSYTDKPFAFFGHSIGAVLSFEVAKKLEKNGLPGPIHLIASALPSPEFISLKSTMYLFSDDKLISMVKEWGLLPDKIMENPELIKMILPPLRADFQALETYKFTDKTKITSSITAFGGKDDKQVPENQLKTWEQYTSHSFSLKMFDGGHFYTESHQKDVLENIFQIIQKEFKALPLSILKGDKEPYPLDKCLHELFKDQVTKTPDNIALVGENKQFTFKELDEKTDLLAQYLMNKGIVIDSLAGIYMETCAEYVIAYIAILKAGGAYLPIETEYPQELIKKVLKTAGPVSILTKSKYFDKLPKSWTSSGRALKLDIGWENSLKLEQLSEINNQSNIQSSDSLAYCVMTSGTTGAPKGIICPHKGAVNSYWWRYTHYPYEKEEREACNVFFVWEAIRSILQGYPCYVIPDEVIYDPFQLVDFLSENKITRVLFTSSLLEQILNIPDLPLENKLKSLKIVYLNGEVVPTRLRDTFFKKLSHVKLLNDYSISECHDVCTTDLETINSKISSKYAPIGLPMANVWVYILDENLLPVQKGVSGEVYVGGASVARGYLKEPEKTKERFIPDPVKKDGSILFRTGDMGKVLSDGNIELQGRIAFMVKLRGYSIVPKAVEAAILTYPDIFAAAVITKDDLDTGQPEALAAYIVAKGDSDMGDVLKRLREHLKTQLPHYAVPSYIIPLEKLPIDSVTGKLNRKKLPDIDKTAFTFSHQDFQELPRAGLENDIAQIWCSLLKVDFVDANDNFFDLGGHSLLAAQACAEIRTKLKKSISVIDIFQYPKLRELVFHLESAVDIDLEIESFPQYNDNNNEIAVVGISARFPGANNINEFWQNLINGVRSIRDFTEQELIKEGISPEIYNDENYVKSGAFLENPDKFDVKFWGLSRKEVLLMDPQHRMFLECCWHALENAGYSPKGGYKRTGIFGGCFLPLYLLNYLGSKGLTDQRDPMEQHLVEIGNDKDYLTSRVAYLLNLQGPAISVQTSCSTALVAVATACESLLTYQCDMALAGASSLIFPRGGYLFAEGHINSKDGHCRAFDANATGTILGDGVGVVALKRLKDAISDNDTIHGIIKGFAINNDGDAKAGYAAPGIQGQAKVIAAAQLRAKIKPESISYIECHGTGTLIGDPIEVRALKEVFRNSTDKKHFCALGSVKPNIGHSNIAAGISGFIKTILALKNKQIPPSIDFEKPNPELNLENSPFYINDKLQNWEKIGEQPRRAGVSCFGIGGTNCHIILEEWNNKNTELKSKTDSEILTLSAKTPFSLEENRKNLIKHLTANPKINISNAAYTLLNGRETFSHRLAVSCQDIPSAINNLKNRQIVLSKKKGGKIVFMFPGGGAQYLGMGYDLYKNEPVFKRYYDECCEIVNPMLGVDIRKFVHAKKGTFKAKKALEKAYYIQPSIFITGYSMAKTIMEWGIFPDAIVGHSLGEYIGACIAGIFSLEHALELIVARSKALDKTPDGAMISVQISLNKAEKLIQKKQNIWLAVINSQEDMVFSGTCQAIDAIEKDLVQKEIFYRRVHQSKAYHTPIMENAGKVLAEKAKQLILKKPEIPIISNFTGTWFTDSQAKDPCYWEEHIKNPVLFSKNIKGIMELNPYIFIETGPGRILCNSAFKIIATKAPKAQTPFIIPSMRHPKEQISDMLFLSQTIAKLWEGGVNINWNAFNKNEKKSRIPLPGYCFEKEKVWLDNKSKTKINEYKDGKQFLGKWFYTPSWSRAPLTIFNDEIKGKVEKMSKNLCVWLLFLDNHGKNGELGEKLGHILEKNGDQILRVYRTPVKGKNYFIMEKSSYENYKILLTKLISDNKYPDNILYLWSLTQNENTKDLLRYYYDFLYLCKALTSASFPETLDVWNITDHTVQVDQESVIPEKSTLISTGIVLSQENYQISCRLLDIQLNSEKLISLDTIVQQLMREFASRDVEHLIALRGYNRWVERFEPIDLPKSLKNHKTLLGQSHVYIITGGLGRIGLTLAEYLSSYFSKLVLTTRSSFPAKNTWENIVFAKDTPEKLRQILEKLLLCESKGAEIIVVSGDMGKYKDVEHIFKETIIHFGKINGIFHAAGLANLKYLSELTDEIVEQEFAPKIYGLQNLNRAIVELLSSKGIKPDFVFLFSSIASSLGGLAMAAYSSANRFMDAFFQQDPQRCGVLWLNSCWDDWDFEYSTENIDGYETSEAKKLAMSSTQALEILEYILQFTDPMHVLIATRPMEPRIKKWTLQKVQEKIEQQEIVEQVSVNDAEPVDEKLNELEKQIAVIYGKMLGVPDISIDDNFFDLGGSSLLATQIILNFRRQIPNIEIKIRDIFKYPSIRELAANILEITKK